MRLIDTYANYVGVTPENGWIDQNYYAIEHSKYVVVHNGTGMPTKSYDHFDEVVSHIKRPVVQVGGKDDPLLPNVLDLRGKTTWNQTAYIIKGSSLFLGGDSICAHMAAHFGVFSILLWGGTLPETCATTWNADKIANLNPYDRYGCVTACHSSVCIKPQKCINSITVKRVLERVQSILGADSAVSVDILHNGPLSKINILEWVPLSLNHETFNTFAQTTGTVSLRADLFAPNIEEVSAFCNQTRNKYIYVSSPTDDLLKLSIHHSKVEFLMIMVNPTNIVDGIRLMKELTKKMYKARLVAREPSSAFNDYKLDIMDYPPINRLQDFEFGEEHKTKYVGQNLNVKTCHKVVGKDGHVYMTFHDALNSKNSIELTNNNAIICIDESHLKEFNFLTIRKYDQ